MPAAMQCQLQHNAVPDTRRLVFESHFLNSLLHTNIFHFRKSHFWSNVCMILARHIFSIYLFRIQRNSDRHIFHGRCKHLPYQGFLGLSLEGRESRLVTPERHLDILNARYEKKSLFLAMFETKFAFQVRTTAAGKIFIPVFASTTGNLITTSTLIVTWTPSRP